MPPFNTLLHARSGPSNLSREVVFENQNKELHHDPHTFRRNDSFDVDACPRSANCTHHSRQSECSIPNENPGEDVALLRLRPFVDRPETQYLDAESFQYDFSGNKQNELEREKDLQAWSRNATQQRHKSPLSDIAQCGGTPPSALASKIFGPFYPGIGSRPRFPRTRAQHPFAKGFEAPEWRTLVLHVGVCALAYPFLLLFVVGAREKDIFMSRLYVGAGCGILGTVMGLSLLRLARRILESSGEFLLRSVNRAADQRVVLPAWATLIHQSRIPQNAGVRLKDMSVHFSDSRSLLSAFRLLWDRHSYQGADRDYRRLYDTRLWSLWILFFLANVVTSGLLPFMLARTVNIEARVVHQREAYDEVAVYADVSQSDIEKVKGLQIFLEDNDLLWTLTQFLDQEDTPSVASLIWEKDTVYFMQNSIRQFSEDGSKTGNFPGTSPHDKNAQALNNTNGVNLGAIFRFPRWGLRIKCIGVENSHIIIARPQSNVTYLLTAAESLRPLFQAFDLSFPETFEQPLNLSDILEIKDLLPDGLNSSTMIILDEFSDDGVAHSPRRTILSQSTNVNGFVILERALIRLNRSFAPHGFFAVEEISTLPAEKGSSTRIGYDVVTCLEFYEPWVLEVYDSSMRLPAFMRIVGKAATIADIGMDGHKERLIGPQITDQKVKRALNSSYTGSIFSAVHQSSVNQLNIDTVRNSRYVPSPMVISFTDGDGPMGYTQLSEARYAKSRAVSNAIGILPYLVGSGLTVARRYPDKIAADVSLVKFPLSSIIVAVLLMGTLSGLFVPRLPLEIPRRGYDVFSWMSAFYAGELMAEERPSSLNTKDLELPDIIELAGDLKFYYVA